MVVESDLGQTFHQFWMWNKQDLCSQASWDAGSASWAVSKAFAVLKAGRKWAVLAPAVGGRASIFTPVSHAQWPVTSSGTLQSLPLPAKVVKFLFWCKDMLVDVRIELLCNKARILSKSKNAVRFPGFYSPCTCGSIFAIWTRSSATSTLPTLTFNVTELHLLFAGSVSLLRLP